MLPYKIFATFYQITMCRPNYTMRCILMRLHTIYAATPPTRITHAWIQQILLTVIVVALRNKFGVIAVINPITWLNKITYLFQPTRTQQLCCHGSQKTHIHNTMQTHVQHLSVRRGHWIIHLAQQQCALTHHKLSNAHQKTFYVAKP